MTQQIKVTKKDIETGIAKVACDCPIAKALSRKFPRYIWRVAFFYIDKRSIKTEKVTRYHCYTICKDFITAFDAGEKVEPFTFELIKM